MGPCDQNQNLPSWQNKTSWLNPASQDQKLASRKNKSIASHDAKGPDGWQSIDLSIKKGSSKGRCFALNYNYLYPIQHIISSSSTTSLIIIIIIYMCKSI